MSEAVSILPPNSTALERALEQGLRAVDPDLSPIATLMSPERCPAHLLGHLAWAFSVDTWESRKAPGAAQVGDLLGYYDWAGDEDTSEASGWSEETKRAVIKASIDVHRRKGTLAGMKEVLRAAGYGDAIIYEEKDEPRYGEDLAYGEEVEYSGVCEHWADYWVKVLEPITGAQAALLRDLLTAAAPARCRLIKIEIADVQITYGEDYAYGDDIPYGGTFYKELTHDGL